MVPEKGAAIMLQGKGFFIWKIGRCENGNVAEIARKAARANFTHVLAKIADGTYAYNIDWERRIDLVPRLRNALQKEGIDLWGWHYVYGDEPQAEADIAIQRVLDFHLAGYVIDAEAHYAKPSKKDAARSFMKRIKNNLGDVPVALSSYRFPSYHPNLPWHEFLSQCDYNMPQVYWMKAHNAGQQLRRTVQEFQHFAHRPPIIPTGAAFTEWNWSPRANEVLDFLQTAQDLNLSAVNFWEWENCRTRLPADMWRTIRDFPWETTPEPPNDIAEQLIQAFNTHSPEEVIHLYTDKAVHITSARTVKGQQAIQSWYNTFFSDLFPDATFTLTGYSGSGSSRHLTWKAQRPDGTAKHGNDTLGMIEGKISYHFTIIS
jgi:hypothetical protein